jgi:signal transduction histidine kinase
MKTEADLQSQRMKLLTYQEQLRALAIDLISTAEKERKQVATELHDGIGQALAVSKMKLDLLHSAAPSRALKKQAHEISLILDRIIENTRELVFELHPPVLHLYGLGAAVKWLAGMLEEQYGLRVEVTLHGREDGLNEELRILLFRTIRELLMNAVKHARTDSAGVVIRCRSDEISASVEDQGAGFDVSGEMRSQGFGLFSIREQLERLGGSVTIRSRSGHGTCVALSLPLQSAEGGNLSSE